MSYLSTLSGPPSLREALAQQLEKIFLDPLFAESKILQRFLSFIVNETLEDRSNHLKEYTIAVNVLDKPKNFRPHENGIVRIHAGRLRRALNHYYCQNGVMDDIQIYVPKGRYVPVISERKDNNVKPLIAEKNNIRETEQRVTSNVSSTFAVLPFMCVHNPPVVHSFTDGLCLRLSEELMHIKNVSVICHQAAQSLSRKIGDFKELLSELGSDYVVTGSTQYMKGILRVNVQIIRSNSCMQIWSKSYERKLSQSNILNVEDEISGLISLAIKEMTELRVVETFQPLRVAAV